MATFEVEGYRPRDELIFVAHASPGRQVARIALRHDRTMFLLIFRADLMTGLEPSSLTETRAALRDVFGGAGWESPQILEAMERVENIYFDRVSQITMGTWSKGRVILIGDAASAVSLMAGEGTGLAMTHAYVPAGELDRTRGDYRAAFSNYENQVRAFVEGKQAAKSSDPAYAFARRRRLVDWPKPDCKR